MPGTDRTATTRPVKATGNQMVPLDAANVISGDGVGQTKSTVKIRFGLTAAAQASHVCQWRSVSCTHACQARQRIAVGSSANSGIDFRVQ